LLLASCCVAELFEEGKKGKNLPAVRAELRKFKDLYESSSDLRSLFLNPVLSNEQKNVSLAALFKKEGIKTAEAQAFLKGAAASKNLGRIKQIVSDFDKLVTYELKEVHASVTSAEPLAAAQLTRLENALKKRIQPDEKLLLQAKVEPSLLGGVIVMLDQEMLDLSVAAQIRRIDQAIRQ
jgi:ATP synthase F1 delta subunit